MIEIIAEAGVAHYGQIQKARLLADAAKLAGADYLKTQVFDSHKLTSDPEWQQRLSSRETSVEILREMGQIFGPDFTFSMHELSRIELFEEFDVPFIKIGSGEVGNYGYIEELARLGRPLVISTGMWEMDEIRSALDVITNHLPEDKITLMHCVTRYPTPPYAANLGRIKRLKPFGVRVGYSDHTRTGDACFMAIALGATLIERHIVLDGDHPPNSQDHLCAHRPLEFQDFVKRCHDASMMLTHKDQPRQDWATKSWHAIGHIQAGDPLSSQNCEMKRPGDGLTGPLDGFSPKSDLEPGQKIEIEHCYHTKP